jgi:predicted nucleic acid-binding protein
MLAEVSPLVALDARGLLRQARVVDDVALKPCDAIHLATAKRLGLKLFHTYDGKLIKFSQATGLKIEPPDSGKLDFVPPAAVTE